MTKENDREPSELLSERLLAFISAEDQQWEIGTRADLDKLIRATTATLEGLGEPWVEKLHNIMKEDADFYRWAVNDWYSRDAVERVSGIVRRFLRLSPVLVGRTPSFEVNLYLREATRCFLWGFFQASAALSRAALEQALNEQLKGRLTAVPSLPLKEKLDKAVRYRIIPHAAAQLALKVKRDADLVLHAKSTTEKRAFDTLICCRGVLQAFYES